MEFHSHFCYSFHEWVVDTTRGCCTKEKHTKRTKRFCFYYHISKPNVNKNGLHLRWEIECVKVEIKYVLLVFNFYQNHMPNTKRSIEWGNEYWYLTKVQWHHFASSCQKHSVERSFYCNSRKASFCKFKASKILNVLLVNISAKIAFSPDKYRIETFPSINSEAFSKCVFRNGSEILTSTLNQGNIAFSYKAFILFSRSSQGVLVTSKANLKNTIRNLEKQLLHKSCVQIFGK